MCGIAGYISRKNKNNFNGWSKFPLRVSLDKRQSLPKKIIWRKEKIGFQAPDKIWLEKHIFEMQRTIINSSILRQICYFKSLEKNFYKINLMVLWRLFLIVVWEKSFNVE